MLIIFWDDNRMLAAALITAAFLVLTVMFGLLARARLRAKPRFMAASIEELKRDRRSLERVTAMSRVARELAMRRRMLLLRSERLRAELAADQRVVLETLGGVDRCYSALPSGLASPVLLPAAARWLSAVETLPPGRLRAAWPRLDHDGANGC